MQQLSGTLHKIEWTTNVSLLSNSENSASGNDNEKTVTVLKKLPAKAAALQPAILFLAAALQPAKIYLLSPEMEDNSPIEKLHSLALVLSGVSPHGTAREAALNIAGLAHHNIYFSVHQEANLLVKIRAGNPWYTLHFIPENIVYDDHDTAYPVATPEQARLTRQKVKETFMKGFCKARRFYECAETEFHTGSKEIALFMLHQAMELACRAITKSLTGFEERVHQLKIQQSHMQRFSPALAKVFNEDNNDDKQLLELLEKGYKDARYNYDFKVDEYMFPLLFKKVKLFHDLASAYVDTLISRN